MGTSACSALGGVSAFSPAADVIAAGVPAHQPAKLGDRVDTELLELMRLIAEGDRAAVRHRLRAEVTLAVRASSGGASRHNADDFFLPAIQHYIYARDTALHIAAAGLVEIAEELLRLDADINATNRRGAQAELVDEHLPAMPYHHDAQQLPPDDAEELIERVRSSALVRDARARGTRGQGASTLRWRRTPQLPTLACQHRRAPARLPGAKHR
jgi:hypothetical protein